MDKPVREIIEIQFGIESSDEILAKSVCNVTETKVIDNRENSVYDPRMGSMTSGGKCITCKQEMKKCPGHFGHIVLQHPVIHPSFKEFIPKFLSCVCFYCKQSLLSPEQIELKGISDLPKSDRFVQIVEISKKSQRCLNDDCKRQQPNYTENDGIIFKSYKNTEKNEKVEKIPLEVEEVYDILCGISNETVASYGFMPEHMHPRSMVLTILPVLPPRSRPPVHIDNTSRDDHLTKQYIIIIKNNKKLREKAFNGETLTEKEKKMLYISILTLMASAPGKGSDQLKGLSLRLKGKDGNMRGNLMGKRVDQSGRTVIGPGPTLRSDQVELPPQIYKTLTRPIMANNLNLAKLQNFVDTGEVSYVIRDGRRRHIEFATNTRGTKLFTGDILIRNGVFVEQLDSVDLSPIECDILSDSLEVVDTPSPSVIDIVLDTEEILALNGVVEILTTNTLLIQEGDRIIRNGKIISVVYPEKKEYKIQVGDTVEVFLQNDDWVVINRQPSLHRGSIMAVQVVRGGPDCKTIRFNLSITTPFNADYDGDEMNIHVPQNIKAYTEIQEMLSPAQNIISDQASKPMIYPVQDGILGAFLMTRDDKPMPESTFNNLCMRITRTVNIFERMSEIIDTLNELRDSGTTRIDACDLSEPINGSEFTKLDLFNGRGLLSMILPSTFLYTKKTGVNDDHEILKIYKGVVVCGGFKKSCLGGGHNSIIQLLNSEYTPRICLDFIDNLQFLTNGWILYNGFTIHLGDVIPKNMEQIEDEIEKALIEANEIEENIINPHIREVRINAALSKARDLGMKISQEVLDPRNNFKTIVDSGSKGSDFNIAQSVGMLGQQNVGGKRMEKTYNNGTRTGPHYPRGELPLVMKYVSQGFVRNSFIRGLSPRENFAHAKTGREGVCDTANKTSESGYTQRKMIKLSEDVKVHHDGTVRNSLNKIIQFSYGGDGGDSQGLLRLNDQLKICNVSRIVNRIKLKHGHL